jgi:hypothetical protein
MKLPQVKSWQHYKFEGYCREHESGHPGSKQLSGYGLLMDSGMIRSTRPSYISRPTIHTGTRSNLIPRSDLLPTDTSSYSAARMHRRMATDPPSGHQFSMKSASTSPSRARTQICKNATAGPSRSSSISSSKVAFQQPTEDEDHILGCLREGKGISAANLKDLTEPCGICGAYFLASILRSHIRTCSKI